MAPKPLIQEVAGAPRPEILFQQIESRPFALWLDSGCRNPDVGRYSFLAVDPFLVLQAGNGRTSWWGTTGVPTAQGGVLVQLEAALDRYHLEVEPDAPPFCGGAAGVFAYELSHELERLPRAHWRDQPLADVELAFYDVVVGWDHVDDRCWVVSTGFPATGRRARRVEAARRLREALTWLDGGAPPGHGRRSAAGRDLRFPVTPAPPRYPLADRSGISSTFDRERYEQAVERAIEYIRAGDIFQVNLSQRFETRTTQGPLTLYDRLRDLSPAPFGGFFRGSRSALLSASPERFLRLDRAGRVQTRPIKGTRPRGHTEPEDRRLAEDLAGSDKDRAENLMIVDLLRNDLSRVCRPGSVAATDLFHRESYATVHHLVSTVEGRLRPGRGPVDLIRAAFPCGSVTGAPKIRAMEIIAELEPVARGPYCGALGYIGFDGSMDMAVAIRIMVILGQVARFHAGGAVVADSDPADEYEETLDKARALIATLGQA